MTWFLIHKIEACNPNVSDESQIFIDKICYEIVIVSLASRMYSIGCFKQNNLSFSSG